MKKILVILSLVAFVGVNVSVAQTPAAAAKETKKEAVVKSDAKPAHSCCSKSSSMKNCSADQAKNCTPAQKAECAKAAANGDKAKAEAATEKKEVTKANHN